MYVGGSRSEGSEGTNFAVERFHDDGTRDNSFGENPLTNFVTTDFVGPTADYLRQLTVTQSDGKILVAGYKYGGTQDIVLSRYLPTGELDTTFGDGGSGITTTDFNGGNEDPTALAVNSDGTIYVGHDRYVARYHANGSLDTEFGPSGRVYIDSFYVKSLAFDSDGKLLVGGYKYQSAGSDLRSSYDFAVARLHSGSHYAYRPTVRSAVTASLPLTSTPRIPLRADQYVHDITVDENSRVIAVGITFDYDTVARTYDNYHAVIFRLDTSGNLDTTFGPSSNGMIVTMGRVANDYARNVVLDNQERIVVGFSSYLHRYDSDGILDNTFDGNGVVENTYTVSSFQIDANDKIVGGALRYLMRWNDDGSPDTDFAPNGRIATPNDRYISALELDGANRIMVAGYTSNTGATGTDYWLARYISEGLAVTVNNVVPQNVSIAGSIVPAAPSAPAPTTADEGDTIMLVASATDPAGPYDPLTYSWSITRNGAAYLQVSGESISFDALDNGQYRATVTVEDGDGGVVSTYHDIIVGNVAPTATFHYPAAMDEGSPLNLSLSSPSDPSSVDMAAGFEYAFDFGDGYGVFSSSASAAFSPLDNGTRAVRGKIRDKDGGVTEYTSTVIVNNVAPTGVVDGYGVDEDQTLSVDAPGVLDNDTDPGSADTHTATLVTDVSHGTLTLNSDGSFTYSPQANFNGTDTFQYKAVDDDGGESAATTVTITVNPVNDAPTVDVDHATVSVDEGGTAGNSGSFGDVDLGDNVTVTASIGNVTQDSGNSGTWTWSFDTSDGPENSQQVTITATDGDAVVAEIAFDLTVNNVAPTLSISGDPTVNEGSTYTLNLFSDDPGDDTISGWEINWGDGTIQSVVGNPPSAAHTYADGTRNYTVLATVTDEDGSYEAEATGTNAIVALDPTFGHGGTVTADFVGSTADTIRDIMITQPDGKILVAGQTRGGNDNIGLARYNIDGSLDDGSVNDTTPGDRFGSDGTVVTEFGGNEIAFSLAIDSTGKIVVGGSFGLARYNADGSLDNGTADDTTPWDSFGSGGKLTAGYVRDMALDGQGRIVAYSSGYLRRYLADGALDPSFGAGGTATSPTGFGVESLAIDANDNVVAAGSYRESPQMTTTLR